MPRPIQYSCTNDRGDGKRLCPNYKGNKECILEGPVKFKCPLGIPNCEKEYLKPIQNRGPFSWKWKMAAAFAALMAIGVALFSLFPGSITTAPVPPTNNVVVVIDGGFLLNSLMVRTPALLASVAASHSARTNLYFGLWGCRPLGKDGHEAVPLQNFVPMLLAASEFTEFRIPGLVNPRDLPESARTAATANFDLFSSLKSVMEETKWTSPNRHLVVITAAAAFPKESEHNSSKLDERDLQALAVQEHVKISALHIIIPAPVLADDQLRARQQLTVLTRDADGPHYYPVNRPSLMPGGKEYEALSDYEPEIQMALQKVLDRVLAASSLQRK